MEYNKKYKTGSKFCKTEPPNKKLGIGKSYKCRECEHQNECLEGHALKTAVKQFNKIVKNLKL